MPNPLPQATARLDDALTVTFAEAKKHQPCDNRYRRACKAVGGIKKHGMKTETPVERALDALGLDDTIWILNHCCGERGQRILGLFACDCAWHVLKFFERTRPKDKRPREAIKTARRFVRGRATESERDAAGAAARDGAGHAAWAAAWAAAGDAARAAARAAAGAAAAWAAARAAAAWAAAWDGAWAAAWDGAWDGEREWQIARLREYLRGERK